MVKAETLLSYSKKPIRESVTKLKPDIKSQITALKIFENLSLYVDDDRSKGNSDCLVVLTVCKSLPHYLGPPNYYDDLFYEIISIVERYGVSDEGIVDEALCQCFRQCTNNPSPTATDRGWSVIFALMLCFSPTRDICKFLCKQTRALRTIKGAIGGFAIHVYCLCFNQLRNTTIVRIVEPRSISISAHIEPIRGYFIPELVMSIICYYLNAKVYIETKAFFLSFLNLLGIRDISRAAGIVGGLSSRGY